MRSVASQPEDDLPELLELTLCSEYKSNVDVPERLEANRSGLKD
jgi:hypothetical protein